MRRLAWKTSMLCLTLAGWTALIAALAPEARSADGWTWPVRGEVLTRYANDDTNPYAGGMHRGIDIAASVGAEVVAARSGEVTYAGSLGYSGNTVSVRSADGRHVASYLHLSSVSVGRGEQVSAGQRVGAVGTTGRRSVDQPHLHFGVRLANSEHHYVDPLSLLRPLGAARAEPPPGTAPATVPLLTRPEPVRAPTASRAPVRVRARAPGLLGHPEGVLVPAGLRRAPVGVPAQPRPLPATRSRPRARARGTRALSDHRRPFPRTRTGVITQRSGPDPRAEAAGGGHRLAWVLPLAAAGLLALALGSRALYRWSAPLRVRSSPPRQRRAAHA
jgi:Peptidase family M23